jgi:ankyrin repeat protein
VFLYGCGNDNAFIKACADDDTEQVEYMVGKGFEVNARYGDGWTPLTMACKAGAFKTVQFLLV